VGGKGLEGDSIISELEFVLGGGGLGIEDFEEDVDVDAGGTG